MGRFMSPDWSAKEEPVPYAKLDDPQTLNLYSYVGNNPLARADADGHCFPFCLPALALAGGGAAAAGGAEGGAEIGAFGGPVGIVVGVAVGAGVGYLAYKAFHHDAPAPAAQPAKPSAPLPDDANVVRGGSGESRGTKPGANSPEGIAAGTGTHPSGVTGFSAESAPGKSPAELAAGVPNKQVGCCTVGQVRAAGGDVVPTTGKSPNHATVTGLTPQAASKLLTPTVPKDQLK